MPPKVSIIIPIYNAEDYLGQCLDSVLTQSLEDIEVICINDGSTDGTSSMLQTYAFLDSRLNVIDQEHKGIAVARNKGIKHASGEYIICLDADDFMENDTLEKMVTKAQEDNSDVVVCGHYLFDDTIKEKKQNIEIEEKYATKSPFTPNDLEKDLFNICQPHAWNKLVKRELINTNKISFDEKVNYAEDQIYHCCLLAAAHKISVLKDCLVYWRVGVPTQLISCRSKYFLDTLKAMSHVYETVKEKYGDKYLSAVSEETKKILTDVLEVCSSTQKKKGLMSIREVFSEEILAGLFPSINTSTPKVSIIIPVYNAADFLGKCIDNCLNQTLKEIEIICVDDGSTDNSLEILNQYAQKDKRITVMHQENQRQAIARNKAMSVATGEFIEFVDADDWISLDACECLYLYSSLFDLEMCELDCMQEGKDIPDSKAPGRFLSWLPEKFKPVFNKKDIMATLPYMVVAPWATFFKHSFLTQNNIRWINKKIAYEDTPFFVESILKAKRVGALKIPFYHRYNHADSTEHQLNSNFNEYVEIVKYTLDQIEKWSDKDTIEPYCLRYLKTILGGFSRFENVDKAAMAPHFYDLCAFVQKKYNFTLPQNFYQWCLAYLKKRSKKEKIQFYFYRLRSCCVRNNYTLNLFSYQKRPFYIKILGIPVLRAKKEKKADSKMGAA